MLSSVTLIITWYNVTKWRSVLNFITINQVVMGTLELCLNYYYNTKTNAEDRIFLESQSFLRCTLLCWSLCAIIYAYIRLVLVYIGKIGNEKWKAFGFTYLIIFLIMGILFGIQNIYFSSPCQLPMQALCREIICACILSITCIYIFTLKLYLVLCLAVKYLYLTSE